MAPGGIRADTYETARHVRLTFSLRLSMLRELTGRRVTPPPAGPAARPYVLYVVAVLAGISFLNALDQTVLPAVAANIQAEFSLSDAQIGTLVSAFGIAIALAAMPLGYWAHRGTRSTIIGVGEASSQPAGASLIGDYVSKRARGRALAAIISAAGLGFGGGFIVGGVVGLHFAWRWDFYAAAAPGLH